MDEAFTLCRKYLARSTPVRPEGVHLGPEASGPVSLDDGWVRRVVHTADTSFLASTAPGGEPDVSHRGGPASFLDLDLDVGKRQLSWPEYIGDGVFKSAGNIRATGRITLLVPDFESGDAVAVVGRAEYTNERVLRAERRDPLEQHCNTHPVQGYMRCDIDSVLRLRAVMHPRERQLAAAAINSASSSPIGHFGGGPRRGSGLGSHLLVPPARHAPRTPPAVNEVTHRTKRDAVRAGA